MDAETKPQDTAPASPIAQSATTPTLPPLHRSESTPGFSSPLARPPNSRNASFYGAPQTDTASINHGSVSRRTSNRPQPRRVPSLASTGTGIAAATSNNTNVSAGTMRPRFARKRSTMISEKNPVNKPWDDSGKSARARFAYFITWFLIFLGVAGGVIQAYFAYRNVLIDRAPLCLVLDQDFSDEATVFGDKGSFFREVDMSGYGNGHFDMTTDSTNNSYVKDGKLYIVPTLTSDIIGRDAVFNGSVYNITGCTFNTTQGTTFLGTDPSDPHSNNGNSSFDAYAYYRACSAASNATAGTVINPIQSARLSTRGRTSIKYGRVEITAKLPVGDWMWPALWMLPVNNSYGPWPLSGEIDIMESRGNNIEYSHRGANFVQASLNWGPTSFLNGVSHTYGYWKEKRIMFNKGFHTYLLEWTPNWLRVSVDSRLHTLVDLKFNQPFFDRGKFPTSYQNGSDYQLLENPWVNGTNATPFDQEFYLIMNVAVGGTQGWFPDYEGDKPWLDDSSTAMRDFARAQSKWYSTWPENLEERAMVVDSVKMWTHC